MKTKLKLTGEDIQAILDQYRNGVEDGFCEGIVRPASWFEGREYLTDAYRQGYNLGVSLFITTLDEENSD